MDFLSEFSECVQDFWIIGGLGSKVDCCGQVDITKLQQFMISVRLGNFNCGAYESCLNKLITLYQHSNGYYLEQLLYRMVAYSGFEEAIVFLDDPYY